MSQETTAVMEELTKIPGGGKLNISQLACAMYEGMPHVQNLAEKTARTHGKAGALSFFDMMGDDVQNFWRGIAKQIIDHSREWQESQGSCCILSDRETQRLKDLPRVPLAED